MLLATLGSNSGAYKTVFVLHLLAVIIGIGGVMLNAVYGLAARAERGPGGVAILKANHKASDVAMKFIYAIPVFGFALIGMSEKEFKFSQTWVWLSLILYVLAVGNAHMNIIPRVKKLIAIGESVAAKGPQEGGPPPEVSQMQALGQKVGMFGALNGLLVVIIVSLMVFKPGT